jgi:AcrR family transcriptional regulator
MSKSHLMSTASTPARRLDSGKAITLRERIVEAAFAAFMKRGYAATTTLEIATRARVSKRELYTLVGNKQELLIACISERAARLHIPADLPALHDRETFARALASFGVQLLRDISDPAVIAVFRLAIAEAVHAPEVARALDSIGREARRAALSQIMVRAQASGLLKGNPARLSDQFGGLLLGDLMISLLLGVAARPNRRQIAERANGAAAAFLQLHPPPSEAMR